MSLSLGERDRRYAAIRALMKKDRLDCLVIASRDSYSTRGNTRYVTNHGNNWGEELVVFPAVGTPSIIASGVRLPAVQRAGWIDRFVPASLPSEQIEQIGKELSRFDRGSRIGVVGLTVISVPVYMALQKQFPDTLVNASWILEELRPIKSPEEIEKMRISASIADKACSAVKKMLRPGVSDYEIYRQAKMIIHEMGCEYSMELINGHFPWGHTTQANEIVHFEFTPAYDGYYSQLLADLPVVDYSPDLREAIEIWEEAYAAGATLLRPGMRVSEIYNAILAVIHRRGAVHKQTRFGHSIGLDAIDFWEVLPSDKTVLKSGMTLILHPSVILEPGPRRFGGGYTYLITETGAEKLNKINFLTL